MAFGSEAFADPSNEPVAHLTFDDGAATRVGPSAPQRVTALIGDGLRFDGVDDRVSAPGLPELRSFSLSLWVELAKLGQDQPVAARLTGDKRYPNVVIDKNGVIGVQMRLDGETRAFETRPVIEPHEWYHLVLTFDGAGNIAGVYVNGRLETRRDLADGPMDRGDHSLLIGHDPGRGTFLDGTVDDVRIYDDVISDAEITALYESGRIDHAAPGRPAELAASPISAAHAMLVWEAPFDNVGVTEYQIYRDGAPIGRSRAASYSDSGLRAGAAYRYSVAARDAAGNQGPRSAPVRLTMPASGVEPSSTSFAAGDRVVVLATRTPVKASPGGAAVLAAPLVGAQGRIVSGGLRFDDAVWWLVAFEEGATGWTREADLQVADDGIRAFPTAEGFGADAVGGRGGAVIEVTNLDDRGPGSLRAAVEQSGPRTIVFRVGGTILVERPIRIRDPFVTIAGQTAPGDGILLRNAPMNTEPPLTVETHDVVIRHLRLRPGPSGEPSCCVDALGLMQGARDVMIDHVSLSWSVDELLGASENASEFTVQWSLLAEALRHSNHIKDDPHSRGLLVSTQQGGNVSIHHNLFAHNDGRNPEVALAYGVADIVNNVLYNPNYRMIEVSEANAKPYANVVGNVMRNGEDTKIGNPEINNHIVRARDVDDGAHEGFVMYVVGNLDELYRTDDAMADAISVSEGDRRYLVPQRQPAPLVRTTLPARAYTEVLEHAGATLPRRDAVDTRIVTEVRERRGRIIDHPREVGGWPIMASGTPPRDADHDGMPDRWERRFGLDPNDPSDRNGDFNADGYTNLEDYLNELAGDIRLRAPIDAARLQP